MAVSQYIAVYNAVVSLFKDSGRHFENGMNVALSADDRKTIIQVVSQGLQSGSIEITDSAKATHNTPKKMYNYATNLVSDRLRKDKRLNGGIKSEPQKPGSRLGAKDKIVKALRLYKKKYCETSEQKAEADAAIAKRIAEIKLENLKNEPIDMDIVNAYLNK